MDCATLSDLRLNENSHQFMLRWGLAREISGFRDMVERILRVVDGTSNACDRILSCESWSLVCLGAEPNQRPAQLP